MSPTLTILIDTNVLYVLLVGHADRSQVGRAKRTEAYGPESYDLLRMYIAEYTNILVTPNILTEVSNLADDLAEGPLRTKVFRLLAALPASHPEQYVASLDAVGEHAYRWLGLTDAAILIAARSAAMVLTVDALLYQALWSAGIQAVNFHHVRKEYGDL